MIERTRYVEDFYGNRFGVVSIIYDKGHFGVGISICRTSPDHDGNFDKFNKEVGLKIAKERAQKSLETDNYLLKDFLFTDGRVDFNRYSFKLPVFKADDARAYCFELDFIRTCEDMIYTLALTKVKEDSVR